MTNQIFWNECEKSSKDIAYLFSGLFSGLVVHGRKIGRELGFPTANLKVINEEYVSLTKGVYAVKVFYKRHEYLGVMNVGTRPSFDENTENIYYEVHILNFNKPIYNEILNVKVLGLVREEKRFSSKKDLISQIQRDIKKVYKYL
ncbi:riboflavin kinase [Priestia megaterium]|uniref:riboflavin kinase n=1 Tax=Priestia megaterium TaxID=1404 RepID=UPI003A800CEF